MAFLLVFFSTLAEVFVIECRRLPYFMTCLFGFLIPPVKHSFIVLLQNMR